MRLSANELAHARLTGRLSLAFHRLSALPAEVGELTDLETLNLSGNELTVLPPEIGQLTRLKSLLLNGNRLTVLPPEIGRLANLETLKLSKNRLIDLPPEIGELTKLTSLDLNGNQLTALPRELAHVLSTGLMIELRGNPLAEPFPELIERGMDALVAYLRSLEDAVALYEAKILLVGEGNVGKTSLIDALRSDPFIEGRSTTHGIEIHPLPFDHPDFDAVMTVRAWDFGGQEIYRITHQFFFSRRAVYLVVWNAREGQEQNEVEGWLRRIRLRVSQNARVLIVATHSDERQPELDFGSLAKAFPGLLTGRYEVDNRTGHGIARLRDAIAAEAARLPQMGQLISTRWLAARDAILALAREEPQIDYDRFVRICQDHGVDGDEIITLAELMHDLGHIVYYGDDEGLRDFVVLNPEWLTKAISYVLEDDLTRRSGGILDHSRLREIWENPADGIVYPSQSHPYFLRLMEKFDVSYRLEADSYRSLVAQLVPHDRPGLPWDRDSALQPGARSLALVCQLSEPVPGLVAWLTVRHHRASTDLYWRNGVFLRHPVEAYKSEALIEMQSPNQLAVGVRAPSPDFFFNVLRDSVEDLISRRWPGLTYELLIPCQALRADGSRCDSSIPMKGLLGYREMGDTHYRCTTCLFQHDVSELLTGFAQPDLALQDQLSEIADGVRVAAGYAADAAGYAADAAATMRRVMRAVSSEISDCPLLFTITEQASSGARRLRFDQRNYQIVMWCEDPGHWHPWPKAKYSLSQPKEWLVRIGPYATLILKALKLAMPLAAPAADMLLTDKQIASIQHELDLMAAVVAELPGQTYPAQDMPSSDPSGPLTQAEGAAARSLRQLLFEHDPAHAFGDMRRVQAPSGDFLWVCTSHYSEYDPGLPKIQ